MEMKGAFWILKGSKFHKVFSILVDRRKLQHLHFLMSSTIIIIVNNNNNNCSSSSKREGWISGKSKVEGG